MRNHHKAEYIIFHINTKNLTGSVIFDEICEQKFTVIIWFLSIFLEPCFSACSIQKFSKS